MKEGDLIWYASYGSNLLRERFLCYIQGGTPEGRTNTYPGCSDSTLPRDDKTIAIQSKIYFAKQSKGWNGGGVGFIENKIDSNTSTLGRMYLITKEQFIEVFKQEIQSTEDIKINFAACIDSKSLIFKKSSWYGNLIHLGEENDFPIFTFTSVKDFKDEINKPNEEYLKTIIKGIKETYNYSNEKIFEYLSPLDGIKKLYSYERLKEIIENT